MEESRIKQYIVNGGYLFTVKRIDSYRDGGTGVVETNYNNFYIHQKNNTIHSSYPPSAENILKDDLLIEYLLERIKIYIDRSEDSVRRNRTLLNDINNALLK